MTCGAMRPTKLIIPTNDTATAADSEHTAMLATMTFFVSTPRLLAVS